MILYIRDLQVLDPGLVRNVAEPVIITDVFLNILPALFDDLFVHKSTANLIEFIMLFINKKKFFRTARRDYLPGSARMKKNRRLSAPYPHHVVMSILI